MIPAWPKEILLDAALLDAPLEAAEVDELERPEPAIAVVLLDDECVVEVRPAELVAEEDSPVIDGIPPLATVHENQAENDPMTRADSRSAHACSAASNAAWGTAEPPAVQPALTH